MTRVVITGIGVHAPLGDDPDTIFEAILAGRNGVVPMPAWAEIEDLTTAVGAAVPGFDGRHLPRKVRRTMGRIAQMAASAAQRAATHAHLDEELLTGGRTSVVVGSTGGSARAEADFWGDILQKGSARGIRSTLFFQAMAHTAAANVALLLGCTGELLSTNAACASSSQAIGVGAERIRLGKADVVLAGGAEELHVSGGAIFGSLQAATAQTDTDATPRPFDAGRDGIVVGEGAGIVVLERLEHARMRGVPILGEVLGYGTSCDARHMAAADPAGMIAAVERCLEDAAHVEPDAVARGIDYINAHATGTRTGDAAEASALHELFGDGIPVSSTKGHLGHTLGACGVIESIVCLEAMRRGIIPPTRNLVTPDVAPLQLPTEPVERELRTVLNTNFAFGGVNSVLLLGRGWS